MPNQAEIASATTENEEQVQEDIARFKPGELVPIDATNDRVDLDEEDESGLTVDEKRALLARLPIESPNGI